MFYPFIPHFGCEITVKTLLIDISCVRGFGGWLRGAREAVTRKRPQLNLHEHSPRNLGCNYCTRDDDTPFAFIVLQVFRANRY